MTRVQRPSSSFPFFNYLRSEVTRARHSALQWLPLLGVPLALLTFNLARVTGNTSQERSTVLLWQAIFVTGLLAPLAAVFASTAEAREKSARNGGVTYRRISTNRLRFARFVVVCASIGMFCLINFGLSALGAFKDAPLILLIGAFCWFAMIAVAGFSAAIARRWGTVSALVVSVVWQGLSIIPSVVEGPRWWILPMAWPMRLLLPIIGVHTNATPLETGATLSSASMWPPLVLCVLLVIGAGCVAVFVSPQRPRGSRKATLSKVSRLSHIPAVLQRKDAGPRRTFRALFPVLMHPGVSTCLVLSTVLSVMIAWIYPAEYVQGWFVFGLLPLGASLLAVLIWPILQPTWALLRTEQPRITHYLLTSCALIVTAVVGMGWLLGLTVRSATLALVTTLLVFLVALLCMVRWGTAVTLALSIILTIFSATIGGDVLADSALWAVALPAWPVIATSAVRFFVALPLGIILVAIAWIQLSRRLEKNDL